MDNIDGNIYVQKEIEFFDENNKKDQNKTRDQQSRNRSVQNIVADIAVACPLKRSGQLEDHFIHLQVLPGRKSPADTERQKKWNKDKQIEQYFT